MTTIYLIRHGDKELGKANPSLTSEGRHKAVLTGEYLKNKKVKMIFASPMERTQQTAEIIGSHLHIPVVLDERLVERMEFEIEKGESFNEFLEEWEKTALDRHYQPIYGDSAFNSGKRIAELIAEVVKENNDATIVMVSHGGAIGDVLQNLFDQHALTFQSDRKVKYIKIAECSLTTLVEDKGEYRLTQFASVDHLTIK